jgi:DNA ligase (NAD+)
VLDSAHLHQQRLYYFVSKKALNIDGVGPKIIDALLENGLVTTYEDLFTLEVGDIKDLPGFKEKAAQNIVDAFAAVKEVPLHRFLIGLSIEHVGEETARLIADEYGSLDALMGASADAISEIHGVGDIVANAFVAYIQKPENIEVIQNIRNHIKISSTTGITQGVFVGKTLVFTGTLPTLDRDVAKDLARTHGAQISSSVSKNTDYVVLGEKAGTKEQKAKELGVATLTEESFLEMLS